MSIWVRRQNRDALVNANYFFIDAGNRVYGDTGNPDPNDYGFFLGEYDSEEEALAVLDQIQNHINYYVSRNEPGSVFRMPEAGFSRIPKEYCCVVCGVNPVDVDAGYDTCPTCAGRI